MFVLFGGFLLHITANRAFRFVVWVFAHKFRVFSRPAILVYAISCNSFWLYPNNAAIWNKTTFTSANSSIISCVPGLISFISLCVFSLLKYLSNASNNSLYSSANFPNLFSMFLPKSLFIFSNNRFSSKFNPAVLASFSSKLAINVCISILPNFPPLFRIQQRILHHAKGFVL